MYGASKLKRTPDKSVSHWSHSVIDYKKTLLYLDLQMCFNVTVFTKSLKCYMLHIFLGCVILKRSDLFLPQNNCGDFFCGHLCLQPNLVLMAESEGRQQGKSVSNVCVTSSLIICTHLQRVCQKKNEILVCKNGKCIPETSMHQI